MVLANPIHVCSPACILPTQSVVARVLKPSACVLVTQSREWSYFKTVRQYYSHDVSKNYYDFIYTFYSLEHLSWMRTGLNAVDPQIVHNTLHCILKGCVTALQVGTGVSCLCTY